jgi:hypothetical protein
VFLCLPFPRVRSSASSWRGSRNIEHIGSAHDAELEALKAAARQALTAVPLKLGPGPARPGRDHPRPLEIASSRMGHLLDALSRAYDALGLPQAAEDDEVFRQLMLVRIIEPTSKQDSPRVLEAGAAAPSYPTLNRLPANCAEHRSP